MYTIFNKLSENLSTITESFIMEKVYERNDILEEMANLQRAQMLNNKDSEGKSLGGYKKATEGYNTKRVTKVTAGDPIILKDTGDFQAKVTAIVDKDKAKLTSTDSKTGVIVGRFGQEVFGLSTDYLGALQNFIRYTNIVPTILYNKIRYGS